MKFIYADSLDFVDPGYDFESDVNDHRRRLHEDDEFPHEHLGRAPYDGILISRAIVGDVRGRGKYSAPAAMRLAREGARAFLRYPRSKYRGSIVMGDCGAFSYADEARPPYTVDDTLEFYEDAGFTHGCSVDHVIFEFNDAVRPPSAAIRDRYDITLENARRFCRGARRLRGFTPLGVIQGWSPSSMAAAAQSLSRMGYNYLAVGGMVPLKTPQIAHALEAIRSVIPGSTKLHVLGFGKIQDVSVLHRYKVASFDTTSPLKRAFADAKKNYYCLRAGGDFDYYTAIRIPQAIENDRLLRRAKRGSVDQEHLIKHEHAALNAIRAYARGRCSAGSAVEVVREYERYGGGHLNGTSTSSASRVGDERAAYLRTLNSRAWTLCPCRVCREIGV